MVFVTPTCLSVRWEPNLRLSGVSCYFHMRVLTTAIPFCRAIEGYRQLNPTTLGVGGLLWAPKEFGTGSPRKFPNYEPVSANRSRLLVVVVPVPIEPRASVAIGWALPPRRSPAASMTRDSFDPMTQGCHPRPPDVLPRGCSHTLSWYS